MVVAFTVENVGLYHLGTFLTIFVKEKASFFLLFLFKCVYVGEIHLLGHSPFYCNVYNFSSVKWKVCAQAA